MNSSQINRIKDQLFKFFAIICTAVGILVLLVLLFDVFSKGLGRLSWDFLTNLPSRFAERSGIYTALHGMIWMLILTILISFPIGIGAGVYLEEYGTKNRLSRFIEVNIANLAGVPSVIYGILGLQVFNRMLQLGNSLLTGALTLALLILPIIIVSTREAVKAVPKSLREASLALGATKWQTIRRVVLPSSFGGIITGLILSVSRAIGETAPLIVIGALVYVPFVPRGPMDEFTVLPIQIFNWTTRPQQGFVTNAAAAIIVLLIFTFFLNGIAVYLRNRWYRKIKS
ncbi:phosphate ABC transporter membrane protein 2 (PhoT family) [Anseongella ginsenosidimutans]|uniref:Phosphate transport system permease protein PstA n=1 Tax=Anseongella ginsenosidimutans TaxID=496056 RepID=A0A4R3KPW4_9SPHI|nr:phosphate ABC transporter permease PstA [Anseongella ginsenosidimutans]QEC52226.1 phosphate ABC transporter permease PstA [Anseongella ginsenosidimutans]TCS86776.1 phosphate ABC transporter membrane protein 2 (PhoT family) [Anseongella ginsenosidimutans]